MQKPASTKPPTDAENIAALNNLADQLNKFAANAKGVGADAAKRLAADAVKLAQADQAVRAKVETAFMTPLQVDVSQLRGFLGAQKITKENLPQPLTRQWIDARRTRPCRDVAQRQYQ